ncbi:zinc finger protein 615-like isoform X2 [Electrophorus electricus]|uniref:zinc finger protein 615-like isoform X2 n=1 Tax=Electrophorus electricus TaxID=8005 RepID=UPI0015CFA402|nr:zinc finger protein 615-like isoform X2 [Electrophorus electricus]
MERTRRLEIVNTWCSNQYRVLIALLSSVPGQTTKHALKVICFNLSRENNLEELNRGNSALGEASGFTGQNQPDREKPSGFLQQHCGGKVPIEITIKQEPNGMDLLDAKSGDPTTREEITVACVIGCSSPEEISSTLLVADNTTDQGTQVMKTTSANLLGKTTLENSAHAQERPFSQAQSSSTIGKTHCAASHSFLSLKPTKTCATSGRSGEKRFACPHCAKRFKCFSQLEIHERSHTGEKPFRCTLCGKMYAQKGHLYTHQRTHTGEKPYRCVHCGKGFIQKCTLDMHQRTHTGEKPFVCAKCGKGFTKKCNLNKHLAVHSDPAAGLRVESSLHDLSLR